MSMLNMLLGSSGIDPLTVGFSGSSLVQDYMGIQTSGFNYRAYYFDSEISVNYNGSWQSVSPNGIFSGDSNPTIDSAGFGVSGNLLRVQIPQYSIYGNWITFDNLTKKFIGDSIAKYSTYASYNLTTSGGLIRFEYRISASTIFYGSYISLA